jgi:hypothetical protein
MIRHHAVDITEIAEIINSSPAITAVQVADGQVLAKSKSQDTTQELLLVFVNEPDDTRLICNVPLKIPEYQYAESLRLTNTWNRRNDSLDTYAYVSIVANIPFILLESYCLLLDDGNRQKITTWLQNLMAHIHSFEELITVQLRSNEDWLWDSSLL